MLEDFEIKNKRSIFLTPGERFDYEKLLAISENEFRQFYVELMCEYRDKDEWWSKGKVPKCAECRQVITKPENLRRYYGQSLDPTCFNVVRERQKHTETETMKRFWNRVSQLEL